ncbi:FAD-dependent oxidoreductase [Rhodoligotrophos defluvii]|uniref:FAD-dependent oxidoreductase n=1 Tax=Rhodoligotrophos defluvii TaxID=2561934 RepID=UPI0010C9AB6C|nr:FAD-dependent oxidoreductase [Rhodoligotrophos defluvii]
MAGAPGEAAADVVVVGGGGSGLAAAISAAECGRSVILLEKNPHLGGSTRWSVGSITASGTPHQRRHGITDTPQAHFEDMGKFAGPLANRDNLSLRRLLTENVPQTFAWLRAMGVEFFGPMEEPPHRVPRMHNVLPNSQAYIFHLSRRARRLGIDIRLNTQATRIVLEGGRATAIEAVTEAGTTRFAARNGIVLAGGDYSNNSSMKAELASAALAKVPAVNPTATGDCQRMVEAIGGEILNGDLVLGPVLRFAPPKRRMLHQQIPPVTALTRLMRLGLEAMPPALVRPFVMGFMTTVLAPEMSLYRNGAVLVGRDGHKLALDGVTPGQAVAATVDNTAFILFDDRVAKAYTAWPNFLSTAPGVAYAYLPDYQRTRPDLCHQADDVSGLAHKLGMPADALAAAVNTTPTGPVHALGPLHAFVVLTDGGVRVSDRLEVLTRAGEPVPGLFAAGSTGQGGLLLEGHGHHLGWAFTSGRIAGRNAAQYSP